VVSFPEWGTALARDYALLDRAEREYVQALPERLLAALRKLDHSLQGLSREPAGSLPANRDPRAQGRRG